MIMGGDGVWIPASQASGPWDQVRNDKREREQAGTPIPTNQQEEGVLSHSLLEILPGILTYLKLLSFKFRSPSAKQRGDTFIQVFGQAEAGGSFGFNERAGPLVALGAVIKQGFGHFLGQRSAVG